MTLGASPREAIDACLPQQPVGADEWQADQGRGVVRINGLQKRNAQRFTFGTARTVIRLLSSQVKLNVLSWKVTKPHHHRGQIGLLKPRGLDRKSTRLNSSHIPLSRMPSSA